MRIALDLPPFGVMAALRGEGAAPYGDELSSQPGVSVSALGTDRLARAGDHRTLCDALAATPRPQARLRVEVDPTDV